MQKVTFRGGRFDGRSRTFGSTPPSVFEIAIGGDKTLAYKRTDELADDGAAIYDFFAEYGAGVEKDPTIARATLPFIVHLHGGPYNGRGRAFAAEPAEKLIIPLEDPDNPGKFTGWFARYVRDAEQSPGRPLTYAFDEKFEGDRS